jgi:hypothetical protein
MSQYKKPIQIRLDDPICSVTSIAGCVVGVLFEKKGSEIKEAIQKRVFSIDGKLSECETMVGSVQEFLKDKERQVKELEELHTAREDEKEAKLHPMEREIKEVCHRMNLVSFEHNAETEKLMAQKATSFVDRFNDYKDKLKKVDEFLEAVHDEERAARLSNSGLHGPQGYQGSYGAQGCQGAVPEKYRPDDAVAITEEEDRALSQLGTLKSVVQTYIYRVMKVTDLVAELKEEKRRLLLIERNLDSKRMYKLDLNKLSAFGFEDVEVK